MAKGNPTSTSKEGTEASSQTTARHPRTSTAITAAAEDTINTSRLISNSSMEEVLGNTHNLSRATTATKLDTADRAMALPQTLLQDSMVTIHRTAALETTTTTSTINMAAHHNIHQVGSTSRATADLLSTARVTVERRSRDGNKLIDKCRTRWIGDIFFPGGEHAWTVDLLFLISGARK